MILFCHGFSGAGRPVNNKILNSRLGYSARLSALQNTTQISFHPQSSLPVLRFFLTITKTKRITLEKRLKAQQGAITYNSTLKTRYLQVLSEKLFFSFKSANHFQHVRKYISSAKTRPGFNKLTFEQSDDRTNEFLTKTKKRKKATHTLVLTLLFELGYAY